MRKYEHMVITSRARGFVSLLPSVQPFVVTSLKTSLKKLKTTIAGWLVPYKAAAVVGIGGQGIK